MRGVTARGDNSGRRVSTTARLTAIDYTAFSQFLNLRFSGSE